MDKRYSSKAHYVVLHISQGRTVDEDASMDAIGSKGRFDLSDDIWIERLESGLAKKIIQACEPPDYNIVHTNDDTHLYAFIQRVPDREVIRYEGLSALLNSIALSRLIHPTRTGLRYCAWVSDMTSDSPTIQAIPFRGVSLDVQLGKDARDWLVEQDGIDLRKLMSGVSSGTLHPRVRRAYWNHEYAARLYELDFRWPLIVAGLESLLNTKDKEMTWQFRDRGLQLARHFNVPLSDQELHKAYKVRSQLVHTEEFLFAQRTTVPLADQPQLYQKIEDLLRMAVRECLLDSTFHDYFGDRQSVKKRWPLNPNPNAKKICSVFPKIK